MLLALSGRVLIKCFLAVEKRVNCSADTETHTQQANKARINRVISITNVNYRNRQFKALKIKDKVNLRPTLILQKSA